MLVKLFVKRVVCEPVALRYFMILQAPEDDKQRYIKIFMAEREAESLNNFLNSIITPRPMTYDLMCSLISLFKDAEITKVIIYGCDKDVYYSKLVVSIGDEERELDCRPSDAIALAVRLNIPIYAECCVLDKYSCYSL